MRQGQVPRCSLVFTPFPQVCVCVCVQVGENIAVLDPYAPSHGAASEPDLKVNSRAWAQAHLQEKSW